jgi:hypothetical protein
LYLPGKDITIDESLMLWRGKTFSQTVYDPPGFQMWDQVIWTMWVQCWVPVLSYNLYGQRQFVLNSIHFRRHNKNGRKCVVTCLAIVEKGPHTVDG